MAKRKPAGTGPNFAARPFHPYALAIGQVALAFNHMHEMLGVLFAGVMQSTAEGIHQSISVWHSAGFDRPKRQMLRAAIRLPSAAAVDRHSTLVADVTWLLDRADELEEARNNSIHGPLILLEPKPEYIGDPDTPPLVMPDVLLGNPRAKKLVVALHKSGLLSEFRWCRNTARALSLYSVHLGFALMDSQQPWPRRPTLPVRKPKSVHRGRRRRSDGI